MRGVSCMMKYKVKYKVVLWIIACICIFFLALYSIAWRKIYPYYSTPVSGFCPQCNEAIKLIVKHTAVSKVGWWVGKSIPSGELIRGNTINFTCPSCEAQLCAIISRQHKTKSIFGYKYRKTDHNTLRITLLNKPMGLETQTTKCDQNEKPDP